MLEHPIDNYHITPFQASPDNYPPVNVSVGNNEFIPYLVSEIINQAANQAGAHAGRAYLWNQLCSNGFSNNDYVSTVLMAYDVLMYCLHTGQVQNPDAGFSIAAAKAVTWKSINNIASTPQLQSLVPAQVLNAAEAEYPKMQNEIATIQSFKNGGNQSQNNGFGGNRFGGNNFGNNAFANNNTSRTFIGNNNNNQNGTPGRFSNWGMGANNNQTQKANTAPWASKPNTNPVSQKGFFNKQIETPMQEKKPAVLVWEPSDVQQHPLVYIPSNCERVEVVVKGKTKVQTIVKDLTMDQEKHRLNVSSARQANMNDYNPTNGSRVDAIKTAALELKNSPTEEAIKLFTGRYKYLLMGSSIEDILQQLRAKAIACFKGTIPGGGVYTVDANLYDTHYTHKDFIPSLIEFKDLDTFEIADKIKSMLDDPNMTAADIQFITKLESKLQLVVNKAISDVMTIPGINVTDVIHDIFQLPNVFAKKFGSTAKDSLVKAFEQISGKHLKSGIFDEEKIREYQSLILDDETLGTETLEELKLHPVTLFEPVSLTYLNIDSSEFGIEFSVDNTSCDLRHCNTILKDFIKAVVNETIFDNPRYIFVTSDDVWYEVTYSVIVKDSILIKRIK